MLSGRRLDLLDPSPSDIEIEDIAHGLARVARWNGQTQGPHAFSVAQHVVVVEEIASAFNPGWPAALAPCSAASRCTRIRDRRPDQPVQNRDRPRLQSLRDEASRCHPPPFWRAGAAAAEIACEIKRADRIAAFFEATVLAGFAREEAQRFFGGPDGIDDDSGPLSRRDMLSAARCGPARIPRPLQRTRSGNLSGPFLSISLAM